MGKEVVLLLYGWQSLYSDCLRSLGTIWRGFAQGEEILQLPLQRPRSVAGLLDKGQSCVECNHYASRWETAQQHFFGSPVDSSQPCLSWAPTTRYWMPSCCHKSWTIAFMVWNTGRNDSFNQRRSYYSRSNVFVLKKNKILFFLS